MIRTMTVEERRSRACYQRTRLSSHKKKYNQLTNSLKKILAKLKDITLVNSLSNFSTKEGSQWKATKKLLQYKASNLPIKKPDGSLIFSDSKKVELFKIHLSEIFQPHSDISDLSNNCLNFILISNSILIFATTYNCR
jgi:hypothetical protein